VQLEARAAAYVADMVEADFREAVCRLIRVGPRDGWFPSARTINVTAARDTGACRARRPSRKLDQGKLGRRQMVRRGMHPVPPFSRTAKMHKSLPDWKDLGVTPAFQSIHDALPCIFDDGFPRADRCFHIPVALLFAFKDAR